MRSVSLNTRLNLWYATVLFGTVVLAFFLSERTTDFLGRHREVALVEQVQSELRMADPELGIAGTTRVAQKVYVAEIPKPVVQQTRAEIRRGFLGGGVVALLGALLGGSLLTRRALRPIERVAQTADRILSEGDGGERVPSPQTGDQLERMVGLFNKLLDSNARMVESMRHSLDSVGHDLRTPLTRIRAAAELGIGELDPEAKDEALATCLEEAQATEQLLASLLDLTRAEAGMLALDLQIVGVDELLARVEALYEDVAAERGIQLEVAQGTGEKVRVDPMRVQQALANLVDNALKFCDRGGRVELSMVNSGDGELVGIEVKDDGAGVSSNDLPFVFDRLYRADRSRNTPGAGLGLAMVKAIAEAHGGWVELSSEEGRGTRVVLWLPRARGVEQTF